MEKKIEVTGETLVDKDELEKYCKKYKYNEPLNKDNKDFISFYNSVNKLLKEKKIDVIERCLKKPVKDLGTLFHNFCFYGLYKSVFKIMEKLPDISQELIRLRDKYGDFPLKHALYGIMLSDNDNERNKLINLLYMKNGEPMHDILCNKEYDVIIYCFRQILVKNLLSSYVFIHRISIKEKYPGIEFYRKLYYEKLLTFLDRFRKSLDLKNIQKKFIEDFSNYNTEVDFKKHPNLKDIINDDIMYYQKILNIIANKINVIENEEEEKFKKNEEALLKSTNKSKDKKKGEKMKTLVKGEEPKTDDLSLLLVKGEEPKTDDLSLLLVKGEEKKVKGEYSVIPSILKNYDAKKIKGVLSITCFFDNKKEYSLHGLWPNQRSDERSDEIYLDDKTIKKNISIDTFNNDYKITDNVSCFSNLDKIHPLHEWKIHGIYANNYDTIDEYIKESCDLALNVIKYLINCDNKHKEYKWYFYKPSTTSKSDGRVKKKSKSLKRRKSKSLKRRKSKSLKRMKSKSLKRMKSKVILKKKEQSRKKIKNLLKNTMV